jgi:hypothetical protein
MYIVGRYVNRGWNSANDPNSPGKVSGQDGQKAPCKEVHGEHGDGLSQVIYNKAIIIKGLKSPLF